MDGKKKNLGLALAGTGLAALLLFGRGDGARAKDREPRFYQPSKTEQMALLGLDTRQQELNKDAQEIVDQAKARLGLPPSASLKWFPQAQQWGIYDPPAQPSQPAQVDQSPITSASVAAVSTRG